MQPTKLYSVIAGQLLIVGLLSACAPNPAVLQDRVYTAPPAPPVRATRPVEPRVIPMPTPTPEVSIPASPAKKAPQSRYPSAVPGKKTTKPKSTPAPIEAPKVVETPKETENKPVVTTPKAYKSSSAVQGLVKRAESEAAEGKLAAATDTIERALRIESDNPDLWMKLSKLNEQQGNTQQAQSMAAKARYYQELLN